MKIGIVGSGIAGLAAAWYLGNAGFEVVVYERQLGIGLDGYSCPCKTGKDVFQIDVPSRLLNSAQWPTLLKLYDEVGVQTVPVESSQSFSRLRSKSYLVINLESLFSFSPLQLRNTVARRIGVDLVRFQKQGKIDLVSGIGRELTFEKYLSERGYSREFKNGFLYPLLSSTVCTCSYDAISSYPAQILLETLTRLTRQTNQLNRLRRTRLGSGDVCDRLLVFKPTIKNNANVEAIRNCDHGVEITYQDHGCLSNDRETEMKDCFDHVLIATQANHAVGLLAEPSAMENEMLGCFDYETVSVAIHNDTELMPSNKKSWATFNMVSADEPRRAMCSVWLNRFYERIELPSNLFQTINPIIPPTPNKVVGWRSLQRPIVNQDSFRGWELMKQINAEPDRRIWFIGSYACPGVPLLENGVVSSLDVTRTIIGLSAASKCHGTEF